MAKPLAIMGLDPAVMIKFKELCAKKGIKESEALESLMLFAVEVSGTDVINVLKKYISDTKTLETLAKLLG